VIFGFRITPFWLLYLQSDILSFLFFRVFRYRVKVVDRNLERCFPEKSKKERDQIKKKYYSFMVDVMLESFKGYTYPANKLQKHLVYDDKSLFEKFYKEGKSMIVALGHQGNWEWPTQTALYEYQHHFVAFFKPLKNPFINKFTEKCRESRGTHLCAIDKTRFAFSLREKYPVGFCMAGDQNSTNMKRSIWADFLGIKTACLPGTEIYAKLLDLPVVFMWSQRIKRGYYRQYFTLITDKPSECQPGEITQRYMTLLEEAIRKQPEIWLWSHKRWKNYKNEKGEIVRDFYSNL
jgi:KDO2-lipid IV(A) lauroyltransferase